MDHFSIDSTTVGHVAAMPFPGRGHINPMMNLCKLLASKNSQLLVTFIITEEWLSFIGSDPEPNNIRFSTIPSVIPAKRLKATDFPGFYEAVMTKMEAPSELLLSQLNLPATTVTADTEVRWGVGVGIRRNIPVALLWTMPATFLSMLHRVKKKVGVEPLVSSKEIAGLVKKFMDVESNEGKDLRERAKQLQEVCRGAIANGGSSDRNLDAFLKDISQGRN